MNRGYLYRILCGRWNIPELSYTREKNVKEETERAGKGRDQDKTLRKNT